MEVKWNRMLRYMYTRPFFFFDYYFFIIFEHRIGIIAQMFWFLDISGVFHVMHLV